MCCLQSFYGPHKKLWLLEVFYTQNYNVNKNKSYQSILSHHQCKKILFSCIFFSFLFLYIIGAKPNTVLVLCLSQSFSDSLDTWTLASYDH